LRKYIQGVSRVHQVFHLAANQDLEHHLVTFLPTIINRTMKW